MARCLRFVVLAAVAALALWLRARQVDSHGLWLDELGTVWASRGASSAASAERVYAIHGQTPLYYLLVRWTAALVGESLTTLRSPSLLAGSLVPLLAGLALWGRSRRAAAAAVVVLGANAHLVFHSHQARPYALAALGTLVAYWGLSRVQQRGAGRDRVALWGGALLAAYAHTLFAPVLLAAAAAVAVAPGAYGRRALRMDLAVTAAAAVPFGLTALHVFSRRETLQWASADPAVLGQLVVFSLVPGALPALSVGGALAAARWLNGGRSRRWSAIVGNPMLVFELCLLVTPILLLLALWLAGSGLFYSRHLLASTIGLGLIVARVVGSSPAPAAGLALLCILLGPVSLAPGRTSPSRDYPYPAGMAWPEWREAGEALDAFDPGPNDPVVLRTGFVEAERVLDPPFQLSAPMRGFLSAPLADRPGRPHDRRAFVLLPYHWGQRQAEQNAYFEARVAPRLASASRFFVVADLGTEARFGRWVEWRFPGRFARTSAAGPFRDIGHAPGVVSLYQAR